MYGSILQIDGGDRIAPGQMVAEQANRIQCYTESDGPDYLRANWSLPMPLGLNTSFGYQPDSHVAFRYANIWLAFTNTFNPSQVGNVSQCDALAPGRSNNMILSWSYDGHHWQTIEPNESFIKYTPGGGAWDCCRSVVALYQSSGRPVSNTLVAAASSLPSRIRNTRRSICLEARRSRCTTPAATGDSSGRERAAWGARMSGGIDSPGSGTRGRAPHRSRSRRRW